MMVQLNDGFQLFLETQRLPQTTSARWHFRTTEKVQAQKHRPPSRPSGRAHLDRYSKRISEYLASQVRFIASLRSLDLPQHTIPPYTLPWHRVTRPVQMQP